MVESGQVPGKGRIHASIEKHSRRVPENVESVRVSKNCPDEYRKGSNLCDYRKMVESRRVSGKGRIRASINSLSRRVPEKGRICVSTGKC